MQQTKLVWRGGVEHRDSVDSLGYLMQHATHSEWHKLSAEEAYDTVVSNWHDIAWELCEETYQDRETYRKQIADEQQDKKWAAEQDKKRAAEQDKKRARVKQEADTSSDVHPHDSASQIAMSDTVSHVIAETVRQTLEASGSGQLQPSAKAAARGWGSVGQPRPSSRPALMASGSGVQTLSLGPSHVSVPVEKMKMMQDSLQRAEHAISASLAFTVEQSNKLAHERLIVQNAIEVISAITGNDSCHFGGLE